MTPTDLLSRLAQVTDIRQTAALSPSTGMRKNYVSKWAAKLQPIALLIIFAAAILHRAAAQPSTVAPKDDVIRPGAVWLDDRGQAMEAHGGAMIQVGDVFYWFGEDHSKTDDPQKRYINCYSSKDLVYWSFRKQVVTLSDPENLGERWVLERPRVFHDQKHGRYVMYVHLDDSSYKLARVAVLVSNTVDGEYRYLKSFRPLGQESRDIGQFVDDDGAAYLIFESRPTHGFFIARLSDDYMNVEKQTAFIREPLEGGALLHFQGRYYVVGSHLTGWDPNPDLYATATRIEGPWSEMRNIAPPETNTYNSQSTMIFKVAGSQTTSPIYMGDRWEAAALWDSRYIWMPLRVNGDKLSLPMPRDWTIDVKTGITSITH
jgi:hypothetical protein